MRKKTVRVIAILGIVGIVLSAVLPLVVGF
jgi:hypothetical protein